MTGVNWASSSAESTGTESPGNTIRSSRRCARRSQPLRLSATPRRPRLNISRYVMELVDYPALYPLNSSGEAFERRLGWRACTPESDQCCEEVDESDFARRRTRGAQVAGQVGSPSLRRTRGRSNLSRRTTPRSSVPGPRRSPSLRPWLYNLSKPTNINARDLPTCRRGFDQQMLSIPLGEHPAASPASPMHRCSPTPRSAHTSHQRRSPVQSLLAPLSALRRASSAVIASYIVNRSDKRSSSVS